MVRQPEEDRQHLLLCRQYPTGTSLLARRGRKQARCCGQHRQWSHQV